MEYTEEIKETLVKINYFIQANNEINYKIRILEREVPNLQELVKKLTDRYMKSSLTTKLDIMHRPFIGYFLYTMLAVWCGFRR